MSSISVACGSILSLLEKIGAYNFSDARYGCVVSPLSPEIADEITIWTPDAQGLLSACRVVLLDLEKRFNRMIPVEIDVG
jgi:hypothetical protein